MVNKAGGYSSMNNPSPSALDIFKRKNKSKSGGGRVGGFSSATEKVYYSALTQRNYKSQQEQDSAELFFRAEQEKQRRKKIEEEQVKFKAKKSSISQLGGKDIQIKETLIRSQQLEPVRSTDYNPTPSVKIGYTSRDVIQDIIRQREKRKGELINNGLSEKQASQIALQEENSINFNEPQTVTYSTTPKTERGFGVWGDKNKYVTVQNQKNIGGSSTYSYNPENEKLAMDFRTGEISVISKTDSIKYTEEPKGFGAKVFSKVYTKEKFIQENELMNLNKQFDSFVEGGTEFNPELARKQAEQSYSNQSFGMRAFMRTSGFVVGGAKGVATLGTFASDVFMGFGNQTFKAGGKNKVFGMTEEKILNRSETYRQFESIQLTKTEFYTGQAVPIVFGYGKDLFKGGYSFAKNIKSVGVTSSFAGAGRSFATSFSPISIESGMYIAEPSDYKISDSFSGTLSSGKYSRISKGFNAVGNERNTIEFFSIKDNKLSSVKQYSTTIPKGDFPTVMKVENGKVDFGTQATYSEGVGKIQTLKVEELGNIKRTSSGGWSINQRKITAYNFESGESFIIKSNNKLFSGKEMGGTYLEGGGIIDFYQGGEIVGKTKIGGEIIKTKELPTTKRQVLDLGSGNSLKEGTFLGEADVGMDKYFGGKDNVIKGDYNKNIPFKNNYFGKIKSEYSLGTLGKQKAYSEAFRVLDDGGKIEILIGGESTSTKAISNKLQKAGFEDIKVDKFYFNDEFGNVDTVISAKKPSRTKFSFSDFYPVNKVKYKINERGFNIDVDKLASRIGSESSFENFIPKSFKPKTKGTFDSSSLIQETKQTTITKTFLPTDTTPVKPSSSTITESKSISSYSGLGLYERTESVFYSNTLESPKVKTVTSFGTATIRENIKFEDRGKYFPVFLNFDKEEPRDRYVFFPAYATAQGSGVKQDSAMMQMQVQIPKQVTAQRMSFNNFPNPDFDFTIPIPFPPLSTPNLSFDFGSGSRFLGAKKQRKKYTPDFRSLVLGIKGKAKKTMTGFESRPIPKGFSWAFGRIKL